MSASAEPHAFTEFSAESAATERQGGVQKEKGVETWAHRASPGSGKLALYKGSAQSGLTSVLSTGGR